MCEVESPKVEKIWKETASHMELTCKMGLKFFFDFLKIEGPSPTIIYPTKISIPYFSYKKFSQVRIANFLAVSRPVSALNEVFSQQSCAN